MAKSYRCSIEVRGYELDSFGHVNHAVYVSYLEHARWKVLAEEGITLERFAKWKRWPVIARIQLEYKKPVFLGESLEIRTRISDHGKTNFTFEQKIYRGEVVILNAEVLAVMINEKGRPSELPHEIFRLWSDRDVGGGI